MLGDEDELDSQEAAEFLTQLGDPTSKHTLDKLRTIGGGPPFRKIGHRVRYTRRRLREYRDRRASPEVRSTTEIPTTHPFRRYQDPAP